ncbi:hypothetical protein [Nostoc sp. JL33]|uniref:hypothetical protein n=1 Tax=Nostoc sp. JL33 TaxID=2815396 RepID=UPI0025D22A68|nr:hypothetical protein [Nostoc sp. JL33]MBN3872470.1 hypothetical protein [Nostoc sp. JL33]
MHCCQCDRCPCYQRSDRLFYSEGDDIVLRFIFPDAVLVESREDIIPRPSQLNLGVRLSPHPASDVLSF